MAIPPEVIDPGGYFGIGWAIIMANCILVISGANPNAINAFCRCNRFNGRLPFLRNRRLGGNAIGAFLTMMAAQFIISLTMACALASLCFSRSVIASPFLSPHIAG